jgi:hypothetical protein
MAVISHEADNLQELTSCVLEISRSGEAGSFLWFRGVQCHTHQLLPSIMRDGKGPEEIENRERRLLTRFRQRSMAYWRNGSSQDDWNQLFAMQHYGMPTRLLDWTENLFVATYFALAETPSHAPECGCKPVLWCVDPVRWNRATPFLSEFGREIQVLTTADEEYSDGFRPETKRKRSKTPVAIYGAHNSNRIVAQRGTFFVWGNEPKPLEEIAGPLSCDLHRVALSGPREDLFEDLHRLGFGETMVFPELAYLARELSRTEGWRP